MATAAQIVANQLNAQHSTGPVTAEGKARVSQNATEAHRQPLGLPLCAAKKRSGLFSVAAVIRPEEQELFADFNRGYLAELLPATPLEHTLAREIVHAAWRLRRCADLETNPPENLTDEELDRLQISVDRARAAAQRTFHRSLKELRRIQTGHLEPAALAIRQAMAADALLMQEFNERCREAADPGANQTRSEPAPANSAKQTRPAPAAPAESAKQTQPPPPAAAAVPRNSPCPCRSGNKYKRCCGKDAPPVLTA